MKSRKIIRDGREWEIPDAFYRISIKVLIKDSNDKLLVVQDTTNDTWEVPGGGLDHGETIKQTAVREIQEELGVKLLESSDEPLVITLGEHPNNYPTLMLYYSGKLSDFDFTLEQKFTSAFVDKDEFLSLVMLDDEAPIKEFVDRIWPSQIEK
jgi:8-oxo-dGTP pyrophosphatase MutT (NUDIX family)